MEEIDNITEILNKKVLTESELNDLFIKYHNGDMNARYQIIMANTRLALKYIYYGKNKEEQEDFFYVSLIGLIKAVDTFSLDKNIQFSTYATTCIRNEALQFLDKLVPTWNFISLSNPVKQIDEEIEEPLVEMIEGNSRPEDVACDLVLRSELLDALSSFSPDDQYIIKSYYGLDLPRKTTITLAKELNISRQGICYRIKRMLNILKRENTYFDFNTNEKEFSVRVRKTGKK